MVYSQTSMGNISLAELGAVKTKIRHEIFLGRFIFTLIFYSDFFNLTNILNGANGPPCAYLSYSLIDQTALMGINGG